MTYYQLLRQRRIDLNLSIQDVSSQTRLAPEYILAIEEHNLDVFSDDFSFVRYFVHAYCDAIGVNWAVVQDEVDKDIHAYARMRNHALTQAQKRIVSSMKPQQSVNTTKNRKKKRSKASKLISQLSYSLQGTKQSKYHRLIVFGVVVLIGLCAMNLVTDIISNRQTSALLKQQEEEYAQKEKETKELAEQYAAAKKKKEVKINCQSSADNIWLISNLEEGDQRDLTFVVTLPESSTVAVYKDGSSISANEDIEFSDKYSQEVTVDSNCVLELRIGHYVEGLTITLNDKEVNFDTSYWNPEGPASIYFKVQYNGTDEPQIGGGTEEYVEEEYYDESYYEDVYYEEY